MRVRVGVVGVAIDPAAMMRMTATGQQVQTLSHKRYSAKHRQ